ncbi:MAG: hypothetical protein ABSH41_23980, partial [Syntrophobacteraceae bacterium]
TWTWLWSPPYCSIGVKQKRNPAMSFFIFQLSGYAFAGRPKKETCFFQRNKDGGPKAGVATITIEAR